MRLCAGLALAAALLLCDASALARGTGEGHRPDGQTSSHSGSHSDSKSSAHSGSQAHGQASKQSGSAHANGNAQGSHGGQSAVAGVKRDPSGKIHRSGKAKDDFKKSHPCPSTGKHSGACPGYVIDHVKPLKRGGADDPSNMQWQTTAAAKAKDKTE
jgi:hypothetical protein